MKNQSVFNIFNIIFLLILINNRELTREIMLICFTNEIVLYNHAWKVKSHNLSQSRILHNFIHHASKRHDDAFRLENKVVLWWCHIRYNLLQWQCSIHQCIIHTSFHYTNIIIILYVMRCSSGRRSECFNLHDTVLTFSSLFFILLYFFLVILNRT